MCQLILTLIVAMVYCDKFIPLTINTSGVRVFFEMIVAGFEVILWVILTKQLFHSRLFWDSYSQLDQLVSNARSWE